MGIGGLHQIRPFGEGGGGKRPERLMSLSGTLLAPGPSIHRKETRSDAKTEARKGTGPSWDHTSNPTQFRYTQMDWIDRPKSSVPASVLLWVTCLHHELVCSPSVKGQVPQMVRAGDAKSKGPACSPASASASASAQAVTVRASGFSGRDRPAAILRTEQHLPQEWKTP